jgi:hypothetical protein
MSDNFDVKIANFAIGPVVGAQTIPMFRVPVAGGGITVVDGSLTLNNTGGTTAAALFGTAVAACVVTFGTLGAAANGTAGSAPAVDGTIGYFGGLGSINLGAGTVHTLLSGTPYVGPGKWIGYKHTAGTLLGGFTVTVAYIMGK